MKYFVNLNSTKMQDLVESGFVDYSKRTKIIEGHRIRGLIIDEGEDLDQFCSALRVSKKIFGTLIEPNLTLMKLTFKKPFNPKNLIAHIVGQLWTYEEILNKAADLIEEILIPVIRKAVIVKEPRGFVAPKNNGFFNIYIDATASTNDRKKLIKNGVELWGYEIEGAEVCQGTNSGLPIIDENSNIQVGEIINDNAYLFINPCINSTDLLVPILKEIARLVSLSDEEKKKYKLAAAKKSYIDLCNGRAKRLESSINSSIQNITLQVKETRNKLTELLKRLNGEKLLQESLKKKSEIPEEKWHSEFDNLFKISKLESIFVNDKVITVNTDSLFCTDPRTNKIHEIGRFLINIYTDTGFISWINKDHIVSVGGSGMQAPHIFEDGHACMGNSEEVFSDLIAKFEFPLAIMMAINFVEDVNTDDAVGRFVNQWPEAILSADGKPIPSPSPADGHPVVIGRLENDEPEEYFVEMAAPAGREPTEDGVMVVGELDAPAPTRPPVRLVDEDAPALDAIPEQPIRTGRVYTVNDIDEEDILEDILREEGTPPPARAEIGDPTGG